MNYLFVCSRLDTMVAKRKKLFQSLVAKGHCVSLVSMERHDKAEAELSSMGIQFYHVSCQRNQLSLFSDLKFIFSLRVIFINSNPDVIVSYTIKPNVYAGLAVKFYKKVRFIPVVTGLGFAFQAGGLKRNILKGLTIRLHRASFRSAEKVIVQNTHNARWLGKYKISKHSQTVIIEGDGVEIPCDVAKDFSGQLRFVMLSRLLGEKGLRELNIAILSVKNDYPNFHVELFGPKETSPDAISDEELTRWKEMNTIVWKGYCDDIDELLKNSDVFVMPSYHEGMSTAVCEAIAYGLPIIGSDIPGIREMVSGNGYLVSPRQSAPLVKCFTKVLGAMPGELQIMSELSRSIALRKFDRNKIMKEVEKVIS